MKTNENHAPTTDTTGNEFGVHEPVTTGTNRTSVCLTGQIQEVEKLRRAAYVRLARTIGISWLGCRHLAKKGK
jgi:hypothetical protein